MSKNGKTEKADDKLLLVLFKTKVVVLVLHKNISIEFDF